MLFFLKKKDTLSIKDEKLFKACKSVCYFLIMQHKIIKYFWGLSVCQHALPGNKMALCLSNLIFIATVAQRVTHLSRNSEDVGSIPGTGRYIVARMTT